MTKIFEFEEKDVEYLHLGDAPLLARLYAPKGTGPFPMLVDLHGGAWCNGDRSNNQLLCRAIAQSGIVVASLDFRQPPAAGYPDVMADIHFGVRWLKASADRFSGRPDSVGLMGISSGGQQAMLLAMRPHDARYSAIPNAAADDHDATVQCVVLCWPVIDPLGRYQYGKERVASGLPHPPHLPDVLPCHDRYWGSEEAMSEGSPVRLLEREEDCALPPVIYLQGEDDQMHPREHLDRFVPSYSKRGGELELALYPGEVEGFITRNPNSAANQSAAIQRIIDFVHSKLG
ncbi:MAG: alpha/beta hydrolase [Pseudomonadota bacterium]